MASLADQLEPAGGGGSRAERRAALLGRETARPVYAPALDPGTLMPPRVENGLAALSLFSGGGGLDLGFERAGYTHVAAFDTLAVAGATLAENRPAWTVHAGASGDVRAVDWRAWRGRADVFHGGPPCQPFSRAGRGLGAADERDLLPEFVRAVDEVRPAAFVLENVAALAGPKFAGHLEAVLRAPLSRHYAMTVFTLAAADFGVPQVRERLFVVGFQAAGAAARFVPPVGTRAAVGARAALGLPDRGFDAPAPTLRSGLSGARPTTSVLNSRPAGRVWERLGLWPNGVAATREDAARFPADGGHHRLAVADCALLQGFPADWRFAGTTSAALGQLGNAVPPPVAYAVAGAVADALRG